MDTARKPADAGTAYGREPGSSIRELTEVGPGTPMGELLRRYWHPVATGASDGNVPAPLRVLGENLILFRDGTGRPGLVVDRCTHRGASLLYGRVEDGGIRCCYHGWLFGVDGTCLDKAVEPNGGVRRASDRQPWYPVQERYGLIFAYLGPPEKKPVLPRYDIFEQLAPGETFDVDDRSYPVGGPPIVDFNWFQHYENFQDAGHVIWLHFQHSGPQFGEGHRLAGADIDAHRFLDGRTWHLTETGMKYVAEDVLADGSTMRFIVQNVVPTVGIVPNERTSTEGPSDQIYWILPIDDTHFQMFTVRRVPYAGASGDFLCRMRGKTFDERTPEEARAYPGDYECQLSQGAITLHSAEHLSASDRGVIMMRRLFKDQLEALAQGRDPIGVSFDENAPPFAVESGRFVVAGGPRADR